MTQKASNTVGNHLFLPLKIFGVVESLLAKILWNMVESLLFKMWYAANFPPGNTSFKSAAIVSLKKICWPKKIASVIYII